MAIVRIEALKALGAAIVAAVPALTNRVSVGEAPPSATEPYPSLAIVPGPLKFDPAQALEHANLPNNVVVFNVGAHEGPVQLRLMSATLAERWTLEDQILQLFLATPLRPGVLIVDVTSSVDLSWVAAFETDSDQWIDTRAFDREFESLITLNAVIPALVTRSNVYTINELRLGLTSDFKSAFDSTSMVPPGVEVVSINQDGTISPVP